MSYDMSIVRMTYSKAAKRKDRNDHCTVRRDDYPYSKSILTLVVRQFMGKVAVFLFIDFCGVGIEFYKYRFKVSCYAIASPPKTTTPACNLVEMWRRDRLVASRNLIHEREAWVLFNWLGQFRRDFLTSDY